MLVFNSVLRKHLRMQFVCPCSCCSTILLCRPRKMVRKYLENLPFASPYTYSIPKFLPPQVPVDPTQIPPQSKFWISICPYQWLLCTKSLQWILILSRSELVQRVHCMNFGIWISFWSRMEWLSRLNGWTGPCNGQMLPLQLLKSAVWRRSGRNRPIFCTSVLR